MVTEAVRDTPIVIGNSSIRAGCQAVPMVLVPPLGAQE